MAAMLLPLPQERPRIRSGRMVLLLGLLLMISPIPCNSISMGSQFGGHSTFPALVRNRSFRWRRRGAVVTPRQRSMAAPAVLLSPVPQDFPALLGAGPTAAPGPVPAAAG